MCIHYLIIVLHMLWLIMQTIMIINSFNISVLTLNPTPIRKSRSPDTFVVERSPRRQSGVGPSTAAHALSHHPGPASSGLLSR